ncbi:tyrosine-type recombinase/integrase [Clostridium saccharoperbutylacetonicum]
MLNDELSIRLLGKLTLLMPILENDLSLQLEAKSKIDETLYDYEVTTKCKELVTGDIEEKAQIFIACKRLEGLSEKTLTNYRLFLNKLDLFFTKPVSTITTMDLRMFLKIMSTNKQPSTVNGYITCLKGFFGWLQNEEYIFANPAARLKQTKVPKIIQKCYKAESIESLRDACNTEREKTFFELLTSTACRISELENVKLDDINWNEKSIIVTGKGNKQRVVFFSTKAKIHMEKYIETREGVSEYLFLSEKAPHNHIKVRALQLMLSRIKKRTYVTERVHAHKFRRTQATTLLNSGMSIVGVQEILGHTTPTTTHQNYARLTQENLRNEFRRLVV